MTPPFSPPKALLLLAALLVAGCDQQGPVAPFDDVASPFSVYGVLDPEAEVHRLRVEVRRRSVDFPRTPGEAILDDVELTSARLHPDGTLSDVVSWQQRAERLPDGTYATVFESSFRFRPILRYAITLERSGSAFFPDARVTHEVAMPDAGYVREEAHVVEGGRVLVPLEWPTGIVDSLAVTHVGCTRTLTYTNPGDSPELVVHPFEIAGYARLEDGVAGQVTLDLSGVYEDVVTRPEVAPGDDVLYAFVRYDVRLRDAAWSDGAGDAGGLHGFVGATSAAGALLPVHESGPAAAGFDISSRGTGC